MGKNYIKPGDHNVISDISGFKYKSSEMVWQQGISGRILVHKSEYSPVNPQLYFKPKSEDISVKDARPRQAYKFYTPTPEQL